jgi:hypothetical protein
MSLSRLASLDRRSENVLVPPVIISELELGNIEKHIFPTHFVERADHAALENRPEAFDGLSVDCADDVLTLCMVNSNVREIFIEAPISGPLIGAKQADFVRDGFSYEGVKRCRQNVGDHASNHIALAADRADDRCFAGTDAARSPAPTALIPMLVLREATNESFIDFDDAPELVNVLHQGGADLMAHGPSCLIRTETHIALNLQRADALLAGQHQMDNFEPIPQRFVRVLEDRPGNMRKAIRSALTAFHALPFPFHCLKVENTFASTSWAADTARPPFADKIRATRVLIGKCFVELSGGQLMDRTLRRHGDVPLIIGEA